jgi:hypothetical protein
MYFSSKSYRALLINYSSDCNLSFRRVSDKDHPPVATVEADTIELEDTASIHRDPTTEKQPTNSANESSDGLAVAAGDFLSLHQRQEEIQSYRRVYIRVSEDNSVQAERLETWIYRSKWLADKLLSSFEDSRQDYNQDETFANTVVDFNLQQLEFGPMASRLISLRSLYIESDLDRFRVYIKIRFLVNRLRQLLNDWLRFPRLQWTPQGRVEAIAIVRSSTSTIRSVLAQISSVPSIVAALDFLGQVSSSSEHTKLCSELERLLSRLGTFPLRRHEILCWIYAALKYNPQFLEKFQDILSPADQQIFHRLDAPPGLEMGKFAGYHRVDEFLRDVKV